MGFGDTSAKRPEHTEVPLHRVKRLTWYKPSFDNKYGKNIALVGRPMAGKTTLALLFGYFNREYKKEIREAGYPAVVELMEADILAEINKIVVLESENNLLKALNDGSGKALFKPFIEKGILNIIPIPILRKDTKVDEDGKVIVVDKKDIQEKKEQFDLEVASIIEEENENTLFIIDSMTAYKKLLDDKFGIMYDHITNKAMASLDGMASYQQAFYANRNTWWENLHSIKRGFKGWNIDTYKESITPDHYLKPGEDPHKTKWVNGTEHNLDVIFRVEKLPDESRIVSIVDGRYNPSDPLLHEFMIPMADKMGAMPLINSMAERLLLGEK